MRIKKIEALRGLVAIYVLLHHMFYTRLLENGNILHYFLSFGKLGVMVFFLISGFVIKLSYEKSKDKSFKNFFLKRFLRIYIPLLIVFLASVLLWVVEGYSFENQTLKRFINNFLMLQYASSDINFCPLFDNAPLWSLACEWWFYMIFFLLIKYVPQKASLIVYGLGIIACIISIFYISFVGNIFILMIIWWCGVEVAVVYMSDRKLISFFALKYPLLILAGCSLFFKLTHHNFNSGYLFAALFAMCVFLIWYKLKWILFDKTIGFFLPFASTSYVIYISHWPLIIQAHYLDFIKIPYVASIGYIFSCLFFSYLVEVIIYPRLNRFAWGRFYPNK